MAQEVERCVCSLAQGTVTFSQTVESHFPVNVEHAAGFGDEPRSAIPSLCDAAGEMNREPGLTKSTRAKDETLSAFSPPCPYDRFPLGNFQRIEGGSVEDAICERERLCCGRRWSRTRKDHRFRQGNGIAPL